MTPTRARWLVGPVGGAALVGLGVMPIGAAPAGDEPTGVSVCRFIEGAANAHALPVEFLTRLIWQESSFQPHAVSPAGARGVAQFMPGTAAERNLADPFDPEQAIPKAAELLSDLRARFGNLGLAAAAYNAGPNRVAAWLAGRGGLPAETQTYVLRITRFGAEDWRAGATPPPPATETSCLKLAALIRRTEPRLFAGSSLTAAWGVQLAGNFSKPLALAAFERARHSYATVVGDVQPIIVGGRVRSRGFSPFYRVRIPAASRAQATAICSRIAGLGGACIVLRG